MGEVSENALLATGRDFSPMRRQAYWNVKDALLETEWAADTAFSGSNH